jgi:uncharacterized protein
MEIMNLVITGTAGAGKTTFIRSVSEIEAVDTDRKATDEVADLKQNTTVAMDFGTLQFGEEIALHIYTLPVKPGLILCGRSRSNALTLTCC